MTASEPPPSPGPAPSPAPGPDRRLSTDAEARLRRARALRRKALLLPLAAAASVVIVGEVAARATGVRPVSGLRAAGDRGWEPAPGVREIDGAGATVGPAGTRGPEAAPGGVLVVGDEFAFGAGLPDDRTAAALLSRNLGLPVTLAACDGYGAQQEVAWIRELAPRLKPAAAVVIFSFDDPQPFAGTLFTSLKFRLQSVSALAASAFPGRSPVSRARLGDLYDPDEIPWKLWLQTMEDLGKWSREARTPVVFAIWPVMTVQDDALAEYYEQVRGVAREKGFLVKNLREDLGDQALESLLLPNGRPSAEAHRRAAAGLENAVREAMSR